MTVWKKREKMTLLKCQLRERSFVYLIFWRIFHSIIGIGICCGRRFFLPHFSLLKNGTTIIKKDKNIFHNIFSSMLATRGRRIAG